MPRPGRRPSVQGRPASCLSCKTRKLRCNRESPCSNCITRNITCQQPAPRSRAARAAVDSHPDRASPEVLERLRRLEKLLLDRQNRNSTPGSPGSISSIPEADIQSPQRLTIMPQIQDLEVDVVRLEKLCKKQNSLGSALSDGLTFKVCSLKQLTSPITFIFQPSSASFGIVDPIKCIWIPKQAEARIILAKFVEEVDYIRHIVHLPSLQPTIDALYTYTSSDIRDDLATGPLALLLSIIATVSQHWTQADSDHKPLFASPIEAKQQTTSWVKAALDVVDHSARVASKSLEHVQALLHICYVLFHLEGFSTQLRSVFGTTVSFARNLGLHIIDLPVRMDFTPNPRSDILVAEMGRRVWWSVVTLDWLLAQHSYPRGDFYLMNPKLMAVNRPRDCRDEDMGNDNVANKGPSPMTFHILKIRLAELCREFAEHTFLGGGLYSEIRYGHVMHSDAELNRFIRELPPAFQLDEDASVQSNHCETLPTRILITQCYMLHLSIQAQLCKLHLPYLFRGTLDPAVSYSRQACLRAAQQIIRIELVLEGKRDPPYLDSLLHHNGILYIISLACIVLVLDSCLGSAVGRHEPPPRETLEAYRVLKNASENSSTAEKLFNALVHLLSKHRVSLANNPVDNATNNETHIVSRTIPMPPIDNTAGRERYTAPEVAQEQLLDGLWQSTENGIDIDGFNWRNLFAGIDSSFI